MNKLQLYITKSFSGYKVLININPSEDVTRYVTELRKVVEKVHYDATEKNIFYYVTTVSTGTFVTIIRTIPSDPVDHLAAWIYIPNELVIDGETLERVVNMTTRKVSGDRVTGDDVTALRELFATEYMTDPSAPEITASKQGADISWRRYNGNTSVKLKDLFGAGLFQTEYLDYDGVFFVDGDLGITVDGKDLTDSPIGGPAVIIPAERTAENFTPYVFGRQLRQPVRATRDARVTFVWKHAGFEDVVKEEVISNAEFQPTQPDTSASRKSVSRSSFQIAAQSGNVTLDDCKIIVNGVEITDEPRQFTTSELNSAIVTIQCEGYAPYSSRMDLAASTRALVRLQERTKVYCFEMPVKSAEWGAPVRFKIYTKRHLDESPIDGYMAQDTVLEGESRMNHLIFSGSSSSWLTKVLYIIIGVIVGLVLGWLANCGGKSSSTEKGSAEIEGVEAEKETQTTLALTETSTQPSEQATTSNAASAPVNNAQVTKEAISYLDDNAIWTREGLEKFPSLKGLFDDMNNFRLEKLAGDWANKLKTSSRFAKVAEHARLGMNPKKKAKSKIEGDTYLKGNESKLTVQNYLYRIDP